MSQYEAVQAVCAKGKAMSQHDELAKACRHRDITPFLHCRHEKHPRRNAENWPLCLRRFCPVWRAIKRCARGRRHEQ